MLAPTPSAARQVVEELPIGRGHPVCVEEHDVGGLTLAEKAAIADADLLRRASGQQVDRFLEAEGLPLANPVAEQPGGEARVRGAAQVRAGVGRDRDHVGRAQDLEHRALVLVPGVEHPEMGLEIFGEGDVERGVEGIAGPILRDLDERASLVGAEAPARRPDQDGARPAERDDRALLGVHLLAQPVARGRVAQAATLLGVVRSERLAPGRPAIEDVRRSERNLEVVGRAKPLRKEADAPGPLLREAREIVPPRIGCSESLEDRIDADGEAGEPGDVGQRLGVEVRSEELHEARIQCGELSDERAHLLDLDLDLGLRRLTLGGGGSHDAASNRNVSDLGEHVHAD
jgi:hypothetical protein